MNKYKKILFISHEGSRTGAPLVILSLIKEIKQKIDSKSLVLFLEDGPVINDFKEHINVFDFDCNKRLKKLLPYSFRREFNRRYFYLWAKHQCFDLIYANTVASLKEAISLKNFLNIPILLHVHETERTFHNRGITRDMIKMCDKYIAVSSLSVQALENWGVDKNKITIVRPFSDFLDNVEIKTVDINQETFVIGASGVGSWRKGADIFPLIIKTFTDKYPDISCKFVWIGNLSTQEMVFDIKKMGLEKYIITPGVVNNPMEYYKKFDVFLLTSRDDPFPLVCMENAALGTPIVLFENTSGIVDLVLNGKCGFIVPYLDINAMCEAIYKLYVDKTLRIQQGNNLRERLNEKFDKKKSIEHLQNVLLES